MILPPRQRNKFAVIGMLSVALYGCSAGAPVQPHSEPAPAKAQAAEQAAPALDPVIENEFNRAIAVTNANPAKAEELYLNMTRSYPNLPGPYANLGMLLYKKKDYANAEIALKRAIELAPDKPEPYNYLGLAYRQQGKFESALEIYKRGLAHAPDHKNLLRNAGILLELYLNSPQAALEYYQRYLQLAPDDKQVQIWIADLNQRIGG